MTSKSLKIERHEPITLRKWFDRRRDIDFNPPYQRRGNIWSLADKQLLIDTIINGLDIPKFYFSDFGWRSSSLGDGRSVYAIIDGKQRLTAIFEFMDDVYPLSADFCWRMDESLPLGGKHYSDLRDDFAHIAKMFDMFVIDVMSVATDDLEDINAIFKRLNKGKALVGAEVRNAALGPTADMIRLVAEHDFFVHSIAFNIKRLDDFNAAAKLLMFEFEGFPTSTKKKDLDRFVERQDISAELIESAGLKCKSHLDLMYQVFNERDSLLRSAGQIPVYYWVVRALPPESHGLLRDFLSEFDDRRAENRQLQTENRLDAVDPVLARYDVLNRNTNDAGSHRARISILLSSFVHWLEHDRQEDMARRVTRRMKDLAAEASSGLHRRLYSIWDEARLRARYQADL